MKLNLVSALFVAVIAFAGCSFSQRESVPIVEVKGRVTLDGEPLPSARVVFVSAERNWDVPSERLVSFAQTCEDGSFELQLPDGTAGAAKGEHRVFISKLADRDAGDAGDTGDTGDAGDNGSVKRPQPPSQVPRELVPSAYNQRSSLIFVVGSPGSANHAEFNLHSDRLP
jgi:hypothetical protein